MIKHLLNFNVVYQFIYGILTSFYLISDTVQLPARKFHDSEDSPTAMSLNEKEQIILNSGEELFAEIRYIILSVFL